MDTDKHRWGNIGGLKRGRDLSMYPFRPKSTSPLKSGQYWVFQLKNGLYVSGVVIALRQDHGKVSRRAFLAGLLDWCGGKPPESEELEGKTVKEFGYAHIKAITENGGDILGEIQPCWGSASVVNYTDAISTWGYGVVRVYGEKYFGTKPT